MVNTGVPLGTSLAAPSAKTVVDQTWASGAPVVADLSVGSVTGRMRTMFYIPAAGPGGTRWAVAQAISAERWDSATLKPLGHPEWVIAIVDRQGRIIARTARGPELVGPADAPTTRGRRQGPRRRA